MVDYRRSGGAAEWHGRARDKSGVIDLVEHAPPFVSPRCNPRQKNLRARRPPCFERLRCTAGACGTRAGLRRAVRAGVGKCCPYCGRRLVACCHQLQRNCR